MDSYKTKRFAKWAKSEGLTDSNLDDAIFEMEHGLRGDSLGSYIFKKRVALAGRGKVAGREQLSFLNKMTWHFSFMDTPRTRRLTLLDKRKSNSGFSPKALWLYLKMNERSVETMENY